MKTVRHTLPKPSDQSPISNLLLEQMPLDSFFFNELLVNLSDSTLRDLKGETLHHDRDQSDNGVISLEDDVAPNLPLQVDLDECRAIPLVPRSQTRTIAAVDVSSINLGETSKGNLFALRSALVWKAGSSYRYTRYGPLVFHAHHENGATILGKLGENGENPAFFRSGQLLTRLRMVFERWIQRSACQTFYRSLVLFDGSLTSGTPDNPSRYLTSILNDARSRQNAVLAISKTTKIRFSVENGDAGNDEPPFVVNIDEPLRRRFPGYPVRLLGTVYLARLSKPSFWFRTDVDRSLTEDAQVNAFSALLGNDTIEQGYPESLRLAHIQSTFTANEVIALQRFVSIKYGLTIVPRYSIRRYLFGPFGTRRENG